MTQIPEKKTVQIDIDPLMIARRFPVEVGLVGNCSQILPALHQSVQEKERDEYIDEIIELKKDWIDILEEESDDTKIPLRPQYIIKVLNEMVSD